VTSDESIHLFWPSIQPPTRTKTKGYQHSSKNTRFFLVVHFFLGLNSPDSLGLISFFRNEIVRLSFGKTGKHTDLHTFFLLGGFERTKISAARMGEYHSPESPLKKRGSVTFPERTWEGFANGTPLPETNKTSLPESNGHRPAGPWKAN